MEAGEERPVISIRGYAAESGCSYRQARVILQREVRPLARKESPKARPPLVSMGPCRDCGEDLDKPHVLGPHLPGCSLAPKIPAATRLPGKRKKI